MEIKNKKVLLDKCLNVSKAKSTGCLDGSNQNVRMTYEEERRGQVHFWSLQRKRLGTEADGDDSGSRSSGKTPSYAMWPCCLQNHGAQLLHLFYKNK